MGYQLIFTIYPQENTNWCWAACASSIAKYYNPATSWTQCNIVNAELGRTDCCTNGASNCNTPWYLDKALARVEYFKAMLTGHPAPTGIETELLTNSPIGARIGWYGGGGHFVVITGMDSANNGYVVVKDPWGGATKQMPYDTFRTAYENNGQLTHTYETR